MLESVPVIIHIIVVVIGIGEEIVVPAEDIIGTDIDLGKESIRRILDLEHFVAVQISVPSRFCTAGWYSCSCRQGPYRVLDADRAMIGGDDHVDILLRQVPDDIKQR